jgi:hypothetical protein
MAKRWQRVVFAGELPSCPDCGEPWCPRHGKHYSDCSCIGPHEDGVRFKERKGVLYAQRLSRSRNRM